VLCGNNDDPSTDEAAALISGFIRDLSARLEFARLVSQIARTP
jgi:hypothetical protein